ncbi:MAG: elongation factor G [Saprospiraceae bacterium]
MYNTENIRNIIFMGHSGSGKTSLAETMLFEAGAISRKGSVEEGNTVSDYSSIEKERRNSIFSTLMHVLWRGNKINMIDTPGYDDFIGDVICSMKVADTGLLVVNSAHGVEVGTEILWEYTRTFATPTILVINQCDHEQSNFQQTLDQATERFGPTLIPFQYPLKEGLAFNAIIDALRMVMYKFPEDGGKPEKLPIPQSEHAKAMEMHNLIVEAAAENDEGLMEKFFENGTLTEEELTKGLRIALANQQITPVFCCSALRNMGTGRLMSFINDVAPSPADCAPAKLKDGGLLVCNAADPTTTLFIYKTMTEPQVGMVSYFKVFSGTVSAGDDFINTDHDHHERMSQIFVAEGKNRTAANQLKAGDLGVTVKLKDSHTNDTLTVKGSKNVILKIKFPESKIRTAVAPPSKNDMEKLMKALHQIQEEDPTLIIEQSAALKQVLLYGQGQLHLDITKYRIEKVNGIVMEFDKPRIMYTETITKSADESYRHKKQSGGAGQFAEVHMRIDPYYEGIPDPQGLTVKNREVEALDWGGHLAFYWCVVGGAIDSKYANAIKKGILQKMEEGPLTGSHCQNIRVCIYDGKMHSVDSNDMAFMLASSNAFKTAFKNASPQLLEPIYELEVLCSDHVMGEVMNDLQTRRAIITGMGAEGHYQKITAKVPQAEMYQYASTLRSLTQGKAKFTRKIIEFAPVPPEVQHKLIQEHVEELTEA